MNIPTTCAAKITKVCLTQGKKAYSIPDKETHLKADGLDTCGGTLTFSISITGAGRCYCDDYCYCEGPDLEITVDCSRCRTPWFPDIHRLGSGYSAKEILEEMLNGR